MTNSYITDIVETTAASTDAFQMEGSFDTLFLASTGSLIALGASSFALDLNNSAQSATLDGTVYSALDSAVVEGGLGLATIVVNGQVESAGGYGIAAYGANDSITVNGLVGTTNFQSGNTFDDAIYAASTTGLGNVTIFVNGEADSTYGNAIFATDNNSVIVVDGTAQGANGIVTSGNADIIRIDGNVEGTTVTQGGYGDGLGVSISGQNTSVDIGAKGDAYGITYGLEVTGISDIVKNSGHISGELFGFFANGSQYLALTNDGAISGIELINATGGEIQNVGLISCETGNPAISLTSSESTIENSGLVHGGLFVDPNSTVYFTNSGAWDGQIQIVSPSNNLNNTGTITGGVNFGSSENPIIGETVDNDGTIKDGLVLNSSSGSQLTNSGTIDAGPSHVAVVVGTGSTFTNSGFINGNVTEGTQISTNGGTWTNTGTIHGNVSFNNFSTGSYTFDNSAGVVTGTITAGGGADTFLMGQGNNTYFAGPGQDTFVFAPTFGHDVISGFIVPGGAGVHDVLSLSLQDFANLTALEADMTNVGNNVLITLNSGSSILIDHTTVSTLEHHTADFIFS
jgi:hypothetical protein